MKRFIAVILLCAMLCGIAAASAFTDANDEYVSSLAEKKIAEGYGDGTFGYADICTREQFITFLWRASDKASAKSDVTLGDVRDGAYYEDAVLWAYENGISKIYSDNTFGVGKPVDREHAAYFIYNWAKMTNRCEANTGVLLTDYTDASEISKDSVTAVAWAVSEGIIFDADSKALNPKKTISRGEAAIAIAKILNKHVCSFSEWEDKGNGTCERVCSLDASHKESGKHVWNDGELTKAPTESTNGFITYTCVNCETQKTEVASAGSEITTRADVEEAVVAAALAYYVKNPYVQYDSEYLSELSPYLGGISRLLMLTPPEYATSDMNLYSVCTDYAHQCYYEGAGMAMHWEGVERPYALTTHELFRLGENQQHTQSHNGKVNEPITDKDVDPIRVRWINFDKYASSYSDRIPVFTGYGVFESGSFTDYTTGLIFKDDGFEGEVHYSYYDLDGKRLEPDEVREKHLYPYVNDPEKLMRPGDYVVTQSHALVYIGNGRYLDCSGRKVVLTTGEDKVEKDGAIQSIRIYPYPFNSKNISAVFHYRPLDLFLPDGYDSDPGNDIVKAANIPEKTKSRIKYPMMSIDRTVDITPYGTAVTGEELTYTIEITNKADMHAMHTDTSFTDEIFYDVAIGDHTKVIYNDLKVTETVPDGCELIPDSVTDGAEIKDGKISWILNDIKPGEKASLSYTVKVNAEAGTVIVNGDGFVDNIPSNVIRNTVGYEKLSDDEETTLSALSASGAEALASFGMDTDFAENILKASGVSEELPSATDILGGLFEINSHVAELQLLNNADSTKKPINLFEVLDEVSPEYERLKKMMIRNFLGGRRFYPGVELKWDAADNHINEFKNDYLEAGDIIICATAKDRTRTGMTNEYSVINVMVFDGEKLLSAKTTDGETEYAIYDDPATELTKFFMTDKDIFFALRLSQAQ